MIAHLLDAFNAVDGINKMLGRWIEEVVASHNLSLIDFRVLDSLVQGTAMNTEQCSKHLDITSSKIASSIDKLEKLGFVQRRREKPDRRVVMLELSDQGLEIYEIALGSLFDRWQNAISNVGVEILKITEFFAGLHLTPIVKLAKNLLRECS